MNDSKQTKNLQFIMFAAIAVLLVCFGIASRVVLADSPNFKPVCAIALFAGFLFSRSWQAVAVVGAILLVSDFLIGGYEWPVMAAVYGSTLLAVALGVIVKNRGSRCERGLLLGRFAIASLAMSVAFFVLTNFAVWAFSGWYPTTLAGLADCYAAAVPFFRWTLASDFIFSQALVGTYLLAVAFYPQPQASAV